MNNADSHIILVKAIEALLTSTIILSCGNKLQVKVLCSEKVTYSLNKYFLNTLHGPKLL
jgi:hypothetical protein